MDDAVFVEKVKTIENVIKIARNFMRRVKAIVSGEFLFDKVAQSTRVFGHKETKFELGATVIKVSDNVWMNGKVFKDRYFSLKVGSSVSVIENEFLETTSPSIDVGAANFSKTSTNICELFIDLDLCEIDWKLWIAV